MTLREQFNKTKRWLMAASLVAVGFCALGTTLLNQNPAFAKPLLITSFLVFFLLTTYGHLMAFRCRGCKRSWGMHAMQSLRSIFGVDPRVHYCPYCGFDIDQEV